MYVYLLTNKENGKYYVGKTNHKNLNSYLSTKRCFAKKKVNVGMPVVKAMSEFGVDKFIVDVLATPNSTEDLDNLEKVWIILLDARNPELGYNVCLGGGTGRTGVKTSEETKARIGAANKGRKPKGYIRTELHRQQLRDRMKGNNVGVKFTSESAKQAALNMTVEQRKERSLLMHRAKRLKKERVTQF